MTKKKVFTQRVLPLILTLAMLIGVVPVMSVASSAADYDFPAVGDTVKITYSDTANQQKNSETGKNYMVCIDDGERHQFYDRHFTSANSKNYDPNFVLYCIEFGVSD